MKGSRGVVGFVNEKQNFVNYTKHDRQGDVLSGLGTSKSTQLGHEHKECVQDLVGVPKQDLTEVVLTGGEEPRMEWSVGVWLGVY